MLAQSGSFVGFGPSTYSFFLSEYRTLQGMATARSVLVDGSKIGTGAASPFLMKYYRFRKNKLMYNGQYTKYKQSALL